MLTDLSVVLVFSLVRLPVAGEDRR